MKLITISSGSKGNCYLIDGNEETLVIEAGVSFLSVKKAIDFKISKIVGCLVSHAHSDHAKYTYQYEEAGIPIFEPYSREGDRQTKIFGGFNIVSFPLVHNVPCYGFMITHKEIGKFLYASDTEYIKYRFKNLNHILVECNHETELVTEDAVNFEHALTGHMSLETCEEFVRVNDNPHLLNVTLCHMSDKNINERIAIDRIKNVTRANVYSAHLTKEIDLRLVPF